MEALRTELTGKGGTSDDWDFIMSEGLRFADLDWVMGSTCSDPWKEANQRLGEGRVVEYRCFDAPKKEQGMAVFEVAGVSDETKHLLKGIHLSASDEYYQWYGEHDLTIDNTVYHVCSSSLAGCAFKLPRRDRRELIHLDQWRLVNPAILVSQDYSRDVGLARIRSAVMKFVPHPRCLLVGLGRWEVMVEMEIEPKVQLGPVWMR